MSTEIIYTCDRCKQRAQTRHENGGFPPLWIVSILCQPIDHRQQYLVPQTHQSAELCPKCVDELRIMKPLLAAESEEKPPTLDDMIRAIVRDEQQNGE